MSHREAACNGNRKQEKPPKNEKSHASRSNMPVPTEGNVVFEFFDVIIIQEIW